MSVKYLLVGPRYNHKEKSKTGGIVVLFENWIEFCSYKDIPVIIIDTNKANYSNIFAAYISILIQIIRYYTKCQILFLHGTIKDYLLIAPLVLLVGYVSQKKVILRKFAGNFNKYYDNTNKIKKNILNIVLKKSDILFWETKYLTEFGKHFNQVSFWFPNVRQSSKKQKQGCEVFRKRFLFLSQVRKEKGVDYLKESFLQLDQSYQLDIYGPITGYTETDLNGNNFHYNGTIDPKDVYDKLLDYDVLLLPTYWKDEGYPGIIIEAFSVGLPVIATKVGGIPEILKDEYNGYLIEPHNVTALTSAIKKINESNYGKLSQNALESFKDFNAANVNERINKIMEGK